MNNKGFTQEDSHLTSPRSYDRAILWLSTLLSPAVVILTTYSTITVIAPVWMSGFTRVTVAFMFLGFYITSGWASFDGIATMVATIYITAPVVLASIMLDFFPSGIGRRIYTRIVIFAYPVLVLCMEGLFLLNGASVLAVPFPLAALAQDARYRQLRRTLDVTTLPPVETTAIV